MRKPVPFGNYLLLDRIAVGGMAEVFAAKAFGVDGFERLVAIKRILPTMVEDEEFISMFKDEARIASLLNHSNIVQIHELGKHDDTYFMAMEYISGRDVRLIIDKYKKKDQPVPIPLAVFLLSRIAEGLDHAHRKHDGHGRALNVIHRDISPQNVLVSYDGEVKIIDFGIAKAAGRLQKTQAGILKGKFGYMSPEQVHGLEIDHRADLYSAGVMLYEMLTGTKLFSGESDFSTLEKVRAGDVRPPSELNPAIAPGLERVVMKALAKDRDERYQHGSELHEDLLRVLYSSGEVFSTANLQAFMQETFAEELRRENERLKRWWATVPSDTSEFVPGSATLVGEPQRDAEVRVGPDGKVRLGSPDTLSADDPVIQERTALFDPFAQRPSALADEATQVRSAAELLGESAADAAEDRPRAIAPADEGASTVARSIAQVELTPAPVAVPAPPQPSRAPKLVIAALALVVVVLGAAFVLRPSEEPGPGERVVNDVPSERVARKVEPEQPSPVVEQELAEPELAAAETPPPAAVEPEPTRAPPPAAPAVVREERTPRPSPAAQPVAVEPAPAPTPIVVALPSPTPAAAPTPIVVALPTPAPAAAKAPGELAVFSDPRGAVVSIDGKPSGKTPLKVDGLPGDTEVVVTFALDGYKTLVRRQLVKAGGREVVRATLEPREDAAVAIAPPAPAAAVPAAAPAQAEVAAPSGKAQLVALCIPVAKVIVNGRDTGRWTPVPRSSPIELPAGKHTVVCETQDGARSPAQEFTMEPGESYTFRARIE